MTKEQRVRNLIEELLTIIANDDVGITADLLDLALIVGEEHGLKKQEMDYILDRG
jgi:hypothetical protein